ncbi:glycosyltransferase [Knoellia aerolata]|nr:glycosyltransferase [Knoellia aerolata]
MRVAVLSTYPPRRCGLATFTTDLRHAVLAADSSVEVLIAAVLDDSPGALAEPDPDGPHGPEVLLTLRQHDREDYSRAARVLNESGVDVVLVQHEYGIFGGEAGGHLLDLLAALTVPYVVTLHTLLLEPSPRQRAVLRGVVDGAAQVTVFTALARDQLVRSGLVPWSRVAVVNHGAPEDLQPFRPSTGMPTRETQLSAIPELAAYEGRRVLSTFGLLSPSKGLEVAIRAMRTVADAHPDALYVVAGRTHPDIVRHDGERYREGLQRLTAELGLEEHVLFLDRYLTDDEIRDLLTHTEVFVTPYRHAEQVVSGVLTFALVAGCAVVSTPYFYATELLSTGAGRLVAFDDPGGTAAALVELLGDEEVLREASRTAYRVGSQYTWPEVGREMTKVLATATNGSVPLRAIPPLTHLLRLVEVGGIVQHAVGREPDRSTGYCVDDVTRLGLVAAALERRAPGSDPGVLGLVVRRCMTFLDEAWDDVSGQMRNVRDVSGPWLDEPHPGDHLGRAIWALGDLSADPGGVAPWARGLLHDIVSTEPSLRDPRAAAFAVLGLARLPGEHLDEPGRRLLRHLAAELAARYTANASPEWEWFEDELTYDNGRLAQALIAAGASQRHAEQLRLGLEALEWYCGQCAVDSGAVVLVGNHWRRREAAPHDPHDPDWDEGDEQCIDAAALVEACVEAYRATGSRVFARRARNAFAWFHGRNRWGLALYDDETGGCHDGVGPRGLNLNQGAESTLAYFQAWLALDSVDLLPSGGDE